MGDNFDFQKMQPPPCTSYFGLKNIFKKPIGHLWWQYATFGYKSYHLSDCYRLYISCKNNIRKALNYQTDLSYWYQLYISCKINIETPITLSNQYETIRSILMTVATMPSGRYTHYFQYSFSKRYTHYFQCSLVGINFWARTVPHTFSEMFLEPE